MKMNKKKTPKRNRIQVLADMLEASVDAVPPTRISGTANVTRRSFKRHLDGLVSRGFLRKIKLDYSERFLYQTTKEGEYVLELIYQLRDTFGEALW